MLMPEVDGSNDKGASFSAILKLAGGPLLSQPNRRQPYFGITSRLLVTRDRSGFAFLGPLRSFQRLRRPSVQFLPPHVLSLFQQVCSDEKVGGRLLTYARGDSVAKCGGASTTDRAQRMEVLRRPSEGGPWFGLRLVGIPPPEGDSAGGVRDRDGCARGRRAARQPSRRCACVCGRDLRAASGTQPDSSGGQRQS